MEIGITSNAVVLVLSTILVGVTTPVKTYIGVTINPFPSSKKQINLRDPIGVIGIQHDLNENIRLFVEHQSSVPEKNDGMGFNHAGVKFLLPIDKHSNLYSGISLHSLNIDK